MTANRCQSPSPARSGGVGAPFSTSLAGRCRDGEGGRNQTHPPELDGWENEGGRVAAADVFIASMAPSASTPRGCRDNASDLGRSGP